MAYSVHLSGERPVIFLVDDDEDLRMLLSLTLQKKGYAVKAFASVADSLAELGQHDETANAPSLAVLDVRLPDGEGWDVLRYIREDSDTELAGVPALVMSSLPIDRQLSRQLKVSATIQKPFSITHFINRVESALAQPRAN